MDNSEFPRRRYRRRSGEKTVVKRYTVSNVRIVPPAADETPAPQISGEKIRQERAATARTVMGVMGNVFGMAMVGIAINRGCENSSKKTTENASQEVVSEHAHTPFGQILLQSEREKDSKTETYRSRLLEPEAVTKHFLKGKLVHTFAEADTDGQNLYHFSILGNKSGYLKDGQKTSPVLKSAAEAADILIDSSHRNAQEIGEWLTWLYRKNGWCDLNEAGLKIEIDAKNKLVIVVANYNANTKQVIDVAADFETKGHIAYQNSITKEREYQALADSNHNLLIPSGISPLQDIVVPEKYLIQNPQFEIPMGDGKKISVSVERLDEVVKRYLKMQALGINREVPEMIFKDDPTIDQITKSLIKSNMSAAQKYLALGRYIQTTTEYRSELDAEEQRPGLVTLFNGGSDCNNRSDLYVEMAYHAGLPAALVSMSNTRPEKYEGHMRVAVPAKYFPGLRTIDSKKRWVGYEMAGGVTSPGYEYFDSNWVVTKIEPFGVPLASEPASK